MFFVLALIPFFGFEGRKTFVLQMMSLLKKIPQTSSICLKFPVKCCSGIEFVFQRKVFLLKWCRDDYLTFASSLRGTGEKQRFYFFSLKLYCEKGQEEVFTVRRGVIVWNCYFRSPKRRANRSVIVTI